MTNAETTCEENGGTVCNTACCLKGTVCRSEEDSLCCARDSTLYYVDGVLTCCGADKKTSCEAQGVGQFNAETCSCECSGSMIDGMCCVAGSTVMEEEDETE